MRWDVGYLYRCVRLGLKNLWRWFPVIWNDTDWDWSALAVLMETKLRFMAEDSKTWITMNAPRNRRQMLVCAELLKRMREEPLHESIIQNHGGYTRENVHMLARAETAEVELLFKLMAKHMRGWWE
jgi:hypothetical protein